MKTSVHILNMFLGVLPPVKYYTSSLAGVPASFTHVARPLSFHNIPIGYFIISLITSDCLQANAKFPSPIPK